MTEKILQANIAGSVEVHNRLAGACLPSMMAAAQALVAAYRSGRKALFFGNGGSAADAQHLAAEFLGRYLRERRPMPAVALHGNSSAVTAIANDYGYEHVFSRQLDALANPGDVAIGISTSGNSPSVVQAVLCARRRGLYTIGLTGMSGGRLRGLVDNLIAVPSDETPRIQECHILVGHALCDAVEQALSDESVSAAQKAAEDSPGLSGCPHRHVFAQSGPMHSAPARSTTAGKQEDHLTVAARSVGGAGLAAPDRP